MPGPGARWRVSVSDGITSASFGIDTTVPSTARMYDYWLGGHDNFAADRAAALKVSEAAPEAQLMAVENRRFLRRAVRYLAADAGITQFLDIGTGPAHPGQRAPGRPGHQPGRPGGVCRQPSDGAPPLPPTEDRRKH